MIREKVRRGKNKRNIFLCVLRSPPSRILLKMLKRKFTKFVMDKSYSDTENTA